MLAKERNGNRRDNPAQPSTSEQNADGTSPSESRGNKENAANNEQDWADEFNRQELSYLWERLASGSAEDRYNAHDGRPHGADDKKEDDCCASDDHLTRIRSATAGCCNTFVEVASQWGGWLHRLVRCRG